MRDLPQELTAGPFSLEQAGRVGVTPRMLEGQRFVRVFPRVYRVRAHDMTHRDWIGAARLTLPAGALLTGLTRFQALGLTSGPSFPLRFVVVGDHHRAPDLIFLHRTVALPPSDPEGATPAAAFLSYCSRATVLQAIVVGDWLLRHDHMSAAEVETLAIAQLWRDGAHEALWVLPHLDGRSRSPAESELRAVLGFAGLPAPEVNVQVPGIDALLLADLLYRPFRYVVEYEGEQHQTDRNQYVGDIDRYQVLRDAGVAYRQVTRELLRHRYRLVGAVHTDLVRLGYAGPEPVVAEQWHRLFRPLSAVVGDRRGRRQGHRHSA